MAKVDIAAETQALPLGYYLSAPLTAAIEAQALSAHSTIEFVDAMGTDDFGELRTAEFKYKKVITDPETGESSEVDSTMTVPLLSMVEAPHMAIEDLTVGFEFNIKETISKENQLKLAGSYSAEAAVTSTTTVKAATGGLYKFLYGQVSGENTTTASFKQSMKVSAAYQRSERKQTDRSATLKMNMNAKQRVPEGFQRVLQIFADTISAQAELPE
jgi:hypothetical protein